MMDCRHEVIQLEWNKNKHAKAALNLHSSRIEVANVENVVEGTGTRLK